MDGRYRNIKVPEKEIQRALFTFFLCCFLQQPMAQAADSSSVNLLWPRGRCREAGPGGEEEKLPRTSSSMQLNFREQVVALKYRKHLPLPPSSLKILRPPNFSLQSLQAMQIAAPPSRLVLLSLFHSHRLCSGCSHSFRLHGERASGPPETSV